MRLDSVGLFWEDQVETRGSRTKVLGPMPEIPETGWRAVRDMPNIKHAKWIGLDTETWDPELDDCGPGWARDRGHIVGISVAVTGAKWYFPMRHEVQPEDNLDPDMVLRWAKDQLAGDGVKIGAKISYDLGWLKHEGVNVKGPYYDPQYAEPLLNEVSKLSLEELGYKYLDRGKNSALLEEWIMSYYRPPKTKWRRELHRSPPKLAGPYAEDDAEMPAQILLKQWPLLAERGLLDLFKMECELIPLFNEMRFAGIQVDVDKAEEKSAQFEAEAELILSGAIKEYLKPHGISEINPNSPASMAKAFDALRLPYPMTEPTERNPDGQPSFTADFLNSVPHPFAKKIVRVRNLRKLDSTFLKGGIIEKHVKNKVYCTFHTMSTDAGGARTGRLACSDPNLQNIPIRDKEYMGESVSDGKMIRECFIMDAGHKQLRDGDYSQIEYRMLAHFATGEGADELRARYNADPDLDYHTFIGNMIALIPGLESYATKEKRSHVKNVNFGVVYGVGVEHMAEMLGLSLRAAKQLLAQIHEAVPFADATMQDLMKVVNRTGIVDTILGRQSHFDEWEPERNFGKGKVRPVGFREARARWGTNITRAYLYRALNYRLQGSAADIIKKGMVDAYKAGIYDIIGVPRLQVHDELLFSDPGEDTPIVREAWAEHKRIMETCIPLSVPIRFDMSEGKNWREAH